MYFTKGVLQGEVLGPQSTVRSMGKINTDKLLLNHHTLYINAPSQKFPYFVLHIREQVHRHCSGVYVIP